MPAAPVPTHVQEGGQQPASSQDVRVTRAHSLGSLSAVAEEELMNKPPPPHWPCPCIRTGKSLGETPRAAQLPRSDLKVRKKAWGTLLASAPAGPVPATFAPAHGAPAGSTCLSSPSVHLARFCPFLRRRFKILPPPLSLPPPPAWARSHLLLAVPTSWGPIRATLD